jgi:hypothetical protein
MHHIGLISTKIKLAVKICPAITGAILTSKEAAPGGSAEVPLLQRTGTLLLAKVQAAGPGARDYGRGFAVVTGAAGMAAAVACAVCDGVGEPDGCAGVVGGGAGLVGGGVVGGGVVGGGVVGGGVVGGGVVGGGVVGGGVVGGGVVGGGVVGGMDEDTGEVDVGPGCVAAGEVCWPLPGLLPPDADGLLPGVRSDVLVTTTVADARAVPICAVT